MNNFTHEIAINIFWIWKSWNDKLSMHISQAKQLFQKWTETD